MKIRIRKYPIQSDRDVGSAWQSWRDRVLEMTQARQAPMREWYHLGANPSGQGAIDYMDYAIEAEAAFDLLRPRLEREVSEEFEYWWNYHPGLNQRGVWLIFPWEVCDRLTDEPGGE